MVTIILTAIIVGIGLPAATLYLYRSVAFKLVVSVILAMFAVTFGLGSAAYAIGLHAVQTGAVEGYHQFLNGSLVHADVTPYHCTRDGGECTHVDDTCDPYIVLVQHSHTDSKGNTYYTEDPETHYHTCPQMTDEYTYTVTDNFGNEYTLADHIFAANPRIWRDHDVDMSGSGHVERGVPAKWQQYKDDIAVGNADPVTVPDTYANYILASEGTILRAYSGDIKRFEKAGLLPLHTVNMTSDPIYNQIDADKVVFAGMKPPANAAAWQSALMHFNAALGMIHQGDMHILVVRASALNGVNPETFKNAVVADWLNELGKNAIAKNGIIWILAVDDSGSTIQWARAATGMPKGNDGLLSNLGTQAAGVPFDPTRVLGNVKAVIAPNAKGKLKPWYVCDDGRPCDPADSHVNPYDPRTDADLNSLSIAQRLVFVQDPFKRACMGCQSAADKAAGQSGSGYVYLETEIPLAGGGLVVTDILYVVVVVVLWTAVFGWLYPFLTGDEPQYMADRRPQTPSYGSLYFNR